MERDTTINTISIRQLGTLLVLALLPLGTEVSPAGCLRPGAQRGCVRWGLEGFCWHWLRCGGAG